MRKANHLSDEALAAVLDLASAHVRPGTTWAHRATGTFYIVRDVALNEADHVPVVVYARGPLTWVRPLAEFVQRFTWAAN